MNVRLRILIDDKPSENLKYEHGLSIYIETESVNILFDTGQSGSFADNAEKMGIELKNVDFAVVSHGHYDHGNGLGRFLDYNRTAPVYIHPEAKEPVYFSRNRGNRERYIGIEQEVFRNFPDRFRPVRETMNPAAKIHLVPCTRINDREPIAKDGALFIKRDQVESEERFDHEIFMVIENENDYIILSGCSHNNIVSIIRHCTKLFPEKYPKCIIGGFHMPDSPEPLPSYEAGINKVTGRLKKIARDSEERRNPPEHIKQPLYITGHCTGDEAKMMLRAELGYNIDFFHTGSDYLL